MGRRRKQREAARTLDADLAALPDLLTDDLKRRWTELYGAPPPQRLGRLLILRGVAYKMQVEALGGLSAKTERQLARAAAEIESGGKPMAPRAIKAGTRMLREWQGVTHEVIVLEDGVQYRGELWPSLSAVAREITGTRWSGPRFFGLRGAS